MDDCFNETDNKDNNKSKLNELLFNNISKTNLGAVTDVSDQFVQLEIKGKKIYDLFSSGSHLILRNLKKKRLNNSNFIKPYRCNYS